MHSNNGRKRITAVMRVTLLFSLALILTVSFPGLPSGSPAEGAPSQGFISLKDPSPKSAGTTTGLGTGKSALAETARNGEATDSGAANNSTSPRLPDDDNDRASDSVAGTSESVLSALSPLPKRQDNAAPDSLTKFIRDIVDKLAEQEPFKEWKTAEQAIYPLGPGTHGWLVNLVSGGERIGYMIITADANGGYTLSEYGADIEGLPYSVSELRLFLAQRGLILLSDSIEPLALYAPLLPYWKVTVNGQTLYVNALVPEILPWDESKAEAVAKRAKAGGFSALAASGQQSGLLAEPVVRTGEGGDPYDNLLWLTSPKLGPLTDDAFAMLLRETPGLVFRPGDAAADTLGGPLMITGYQLWTTVEPGGGKTTMYAATGSGGRRFLPLDALRQSGGFQVYVTSY